MDKDEDSAVKIMPVCVVSVTALLLDVSMKMGNQTRKNKHGECQEEQGDILIDFLAVIITPKFISVAKQNIIYVLSIVIHTY